VSLDRLNGIAHADQIAAVNAQYQNEKIQRAIRTRTMAKILGLPPEEVSEEMLAGGNITINQPGPNRTGIWIFASVLLLVVVAAGLWLASGRSPVLPSQPGTPFVPAPGGNPGLDLRYDPPNPPLLQ